MLVGGLPFETVEEGLRAVGSKLGDDVIASPDEEVGPRKMWCMFLATDTYSKHHNLVESCVHAAYSKAMKAEILKMLEVIPADDLAIQLDLHSAPKMPGLNI
jgi:hypothetical protein